MLFISLIFLAVFLSLYFSSSLQTLMAKRHILYSWWSLTSAFYDGNDNSLCLLETHSLTHPVITFTVHHLAHVVSPDLLIFLQVGMGLWGETSRFVRRTVNTNILFYVFVKVQHSNRLAGFQVIILCFFQTTQTKICLQRWAQEKEEGVQLMPVLWPG